MIVARCRLESTAAYSQSAPIVEAKRDKELFKDFEERTWRKRMHVTEDGHVFIPPMSFKVCIAEAAKYLSVQVPGKGKATYTKNFEAGVLVIEPVVLSVKAADVKGEWLYLPSDGRRGGTTRVWKCYPCIPAWTATVEFVIIDMMITEDAFRYHLEQAGQLIGIGRFRPRNNGYYGRFKVLSIEWSKSE